MPQIIVIADTPSEDGAAHVVFRERVTERLFKSGHFSRQLVERIGWAVGDAHVADRRWERTETDPLAGSVPAEHVSAETQADAAVAAEHVSAETSQRPSERVVTTAS